MLVSVGILMSHILLLSLVKQVLRLFLKPGYARSFVWDVLLSFEMGCMALEQGVLLQHYGLFYWELSLLFVVVWQVTTWEGASANALPFIASKTAAGFVRTVCMQLAMFASYRYMCLLWSLELSPAHIDRPRLTSSAVCSFPWAGEPITGMFMTEFVGSSVLLVLPGLILGNSALKEQDPTKIFRGLLVGVSVLLTVLPGMERSGGMYNPTLATLLLAGCSGLSWSRLATVYWGAPLLAAWGGEWLAKRFNTAGKAKAE